MDADAIEASLQEFLRDELRVKDAPVARDVELVTTGIIDSMDLVRIAAHLERLLGVSIPDEDVNQEHFDSIARMLAYLETKLES